MPTPLRRANRSEVEHYSPRTGLRNRHRYHAQRMLRVRSPKQMPNWYWRLILVREGLWCHQCDQEIVLQNRTLSDRKYTWMHTRKRGRKALHVRSPIARNTTAKGVYRR